MPVRYNTNYKSKFIIDVSIIEDYLKENKNKKLSASTIYANLKIKRNKMTWILNHSKHIRRVNPVEVGSKKQKVHVYTFVE
tara:strand:+ start:90 stop:332 length:243 start_codon:yes stop_codon:yes gene_type:complete